MRLVVVVGGERRLAILCMCGPEMLSVCSPSSFVRVGILLLKGQALFIALQKKGLFFIAEIVGSFRNIVNISCLCNLLKCL